MPFVGRSGKLLDSHDGRRSGSTARKVYIANVVPWRPPGNRTPTPQETAICLPFIRRQIELADPDILVCLGQPATQTLLGTKEGITQTRGRWFKFDTGSREIRAHRDLPSRLPAAQPAAEAACLAGFSGDQEGAADDARVVITVASATCAEARHAIAGLITPQPIRNGGRRPCTGRSKAVRHFGNEIGKMRLDFRRRRRIRVGRQPHDHGALFGGCLPA